MPRDGSGVYSVPPGTRGTPNTTIESAKYNGLLDDLTQDANSARPITAGGTGEIAARLADGTWRFKNTADATKLLALDLSGITTGTTRTLTIPNQNGTIATTGAGTTDNSMARFDGTGGQLQNSGVVVDDSNNMSGVGTLTASRTINVKSASAAVGPADYRVIGSAGAVLGYFGISGAGSEIEVWNSQAAAINFGTSDTLRAWITSAGAFIIGAAASGSGGSNGKTLSGDAFESSRNTTGSATHQFYYNPNGTVGTISTSGSATAYNTSSDEELKVFDGEYDFESAIAIIRADPVRRFRWKSDDTKAIGWGAQTSYAVSPELATPGNGAPGDDDYIPWGIDQSKRTPYLWAAVAGLLDRLEEVEARLYQLETGGN